MSKEFDLSFEGSEARAAKGLCGLCSNNVFVDEHGFRICALCGAENLIGYRCPGCRSKSGMGDKLRGCAFCGQQLMPGERHACGVCGNDHGDGRECQFCGTI